MIVTTIVVEKEENVVESMDDDIERNGTRIERFKGRLLSTARDGGQRRERREKEKRARELRIREQLTRQETRTKVCSCTSVCT